MHDMVATTLAEMEVIDQVFEDHFNRAEKLDFFVAEQSLVDSSESAQSDNDMQKLDHLTDLVQSTLLASDFVQINKILMESLESNNELIPDDKSTTQENSHQTSSLRL